MIKHLGLAAGLLGSVCALALADPDRTITPAQEFVAEHVATIDQELKVGTVLPARPLDQILRLELLEGELKVRIVARDVGEQATIPLEGVRGVCQIQRLGENFPIPDAMRVSIHTLDISQAKAINVDIASFGRLQFDVLLNTPEVAMTTQLMAPVSSGIVLDDNEPRFHVQVVSETGAGSMPAVMRTAPTIPRLIDENHEQLAESIGEALRLMKAMHLLSGMSDAEVRQMLASNAPTSSEVVNRVGHVVATMRTDPDAGEAQLQDLLKEKGVSAASALSRVSRDGWTPDMTLRVDNALAPYRNRSSAAAANVNTQPRRLVDLLYWPDPAIRQAALARLRELHPVQIDLDPARDPYTQTDAIEALRTQLK